jgi:hypothetical protein
MKKATHAYSPILPQSVGKHSVFKINFSVLDPSVMLFTVIIQSNFNLILPAALGPGVYSASNRNEYQKHKNNNVSGE